MRRGVQRIIFGVVGAAAGFAYYTYIGCASGTCPITSSPYISTAYGALVGVLLGGATKSAKPEEKA